jgi:hypothetical protein
MDSSEHVSDADPRYATAEPPDVGARGLAALALHDLVAMGVGAVMALHSVDRSTATGTLRRTAYHFGVPASAVAHAVLTLVGGTDEHLGDRAGRAAAHLLMQGLTPAP